MAALKNVKHEEFVQAWHQTGNKSEAYRQAYPRSKKWKDRTVNTRASELSKNSEVLGRYEELQEKTSKGHEITVETILQELEEARDVAKSEGQASAMVAASKEKARMAGVLPANELNVNAKGISLNVSIKGKDASD